MKLKTSIIIMVTILFLTGCTENAQPVRTAEMKSLQEYTVSTANAQLQLFQTVDNNRILIDVYDIPMSEGYSYSLAGADVENIYYLKTKDVPMGVTILESSIVSVSRENGLENQVCGIKSGEEHWVNEAFSTDDYFCWCLFDYKKNNCLIQVYDRNEQTVNTVKTVELSGNTGVVLSAAEHFIVWPEWEITDNNYLQGCLYVYDAQTQNTELISNNIYSKSPYSRFPIDDGYVAFAEYDDQDMQIKVYNLKEMLYESSVEINLKNPGNIMISENRIVLSDGPYETLQPLDIYSIDLNEMNIQKVHSVSENNDIFSFHLMGSLLFISDDKQDYARLICRDLCAGIEFEPVNIQEGYFLFGRISEGRYFLVEDLYNRHLYVISNL